VKILAKHVLECASAGVTFALLGAEASRLAHQSSSACTLAIHLGRLSVNSTALGVACSIPDDWNHTYNHPFDCAS